MFDIFLTVYFFTKEHPLKTSKKIPHTTLLIHQFVSLIELKIHQLINHLTNMCKFKIDKISYSMS